MIVMIQSADSLTKSKLEAFEGQKHDMKVRTIILARRLRRLYVRGELMPPQTRT